MKISVFYHHIAEAAAQSGREIRDVIRYARSLGIKWAEMDFSAISAAEMLKSEGMEISSIYAFYDFGNNPDGSVGFGHIDRAAEIGCEKIMIIPGFYSSADGAVREKERENMLAAMREMCAYAHSKGITPTIEDFDDSKSPIATARQMLWFAERIPELKITFDTGNFMFSGEDELTAFGLLKDRIAHVHCKDRTFSKNSGEPKAAADGRIMYPAAVGCGDIKMSEIISELERGGYGGIYVIEHFGAENQLEYMKKSADFLRGAGEVQ